jgi:hypothetical protein
MGTVEIIGNLWPLKGPKDRITGREIARRKDCEVTKQPNSVGRLSSRCLHFHSEGGGSRFLQNVVTYVSQYMSHTEGTVLRNATG